MEGRVLLVTGSMGSGKTTVLGECSDLLRDRGIDHVAIDVDALNTVHLASSHDPGVRLRQREVMFRNLRSVWTHSAAAGAQLLMLAEAMEHRDELDAICDAVGVTRITVCRLVASLTTMRRRIKLREPGMLQDQFVRRVEELEHLLDAAHLEDFSVVNEDRSVTDVAREVLIRAGWITTPSDIASSRQE